MTKKGAINFRYITGPLLHLRLFILDQRIEMAVRIHGRRPRIGQADASKAAHPLRPPELGLGLGRSEYTINGSSAPDPLGQLDL